MVLNRHHTPPARGTGHGRGLHRGGADRIDAGDGGGQDDHRSHGRGPAAGRRRYQGIDFGVDFGRERLRAAPFFPAPASAAAVPRPLPLPARSRASLSASLAAINSCDRRRNRRYPAASARACAAACAGMIRVTVFPDCLRVSDSTGSRGASPGGAQPQPVLPQRRQRAISDPERISPIEASYWQRRARRCSSAAIDSSGMAGLLQ